MGGMYIAFTADSSVQGTGFSATYSTTSFFAAAPFTPVPFGANAIPSPIVPCSGTVTLTASTGVVTDGSGSGASYSPNQNCVWTISTSGAVTLSFSSFNLE